MTDHLPECIEYPIPDFNNGVWLCICPALRACEQRVRQEIDREAFVLDEGDPFRQAYRRGLDAAREAVAAVGVRKDTSHDMRVQALAAIDALRGSGNPHTPPSAEKGEQA